MTYQHNQHQTGERLLFGATRRFIPVIAGLSMALLTASLAQASERGTAPSAGSGMMLAQAVPPKSGVPPGGPKVSTPNQSQAIPAPGASHRGVGQGAGSASGGNVCAAPSDQHAGGSSGGGGGSSEPLAEVLPDSATLEASKSGASLPALATSESAPQSLGNSCVTITLRPDPTRSDVSFVNLTQDGVLRTAVSHNHIREVMSRAGYRQVSLDQNVKWCVTQAVMRELLDKTAPERSAAQNMTLVQTPQGLKLMTRQQALAHQLSQQPSEPTAQVQPSDASALPTQ
jgi:hypothetical protein